MVIINSYVSPDQQHKPSNEALTHGEREMAQGDFSGAVCSVIESYEALWLSASSVSMWPSMLVSGNSSPPGDLIKNPEKPQFPCEFPYEWNMVTDSTFTSLVDASVESHEAESEVEDDDYIADLAEKIAHSMLDADDTTDQKQNSKRWNPEKRSPCVEDVGKGFFHQFISPGSESWSTISWSSSNSVASSNGSSRVSSSPSTPLRANNDTWELLYAAAGEAVSMDRSEQTNVSTALLGEGQQLGSAVRNQWQQSTWDEGERIRNRFQIKLSGYPSLCSWHGDKTASWAQFSQRSSVNAGFREEDCRSPGTQSGLPKQASVSPALRQNEPPLQQQSSGCGRAYKGVSGPRVSWNIDVSSSQCAAFQPAGGSGLRAVFLGSNPSGRESAGTGVFLPRPIGRGTDAKRKPTCSTVLLPSRIIQALNLNVEDVRSPLIRPNNSYTQPATAIRRDSSFLPSRPSTPYSPVQPAAGREIGAKVNPLWKSAYPTCSSLQQVAPEIALPTEWTY